MTRRRGKGNRVVPSSSRKRSLYILPEIKDDASVSEKNALAIRNACSVNGVCPCCGARAVVTQDARHTHLQHVWFAHETWCIVIADGEAS